MGRGLTFACCALFPALACTPLHDLRDVTGGSPGDEGSGGMIQQVGGAGGQGAGGSGSGGNATSAGGTGAMGGGGPLEVCSESYAFCEDFEDGDQSSWSVSGGTWAIVPEGGNLSYNGWGSSNERAIAGESDWQNIVLRARVRVLSFGNTTDAHRVGIIGRYGSSSSYYVLSVGGDGNAELRKSTSDPGGSSGTCGPIPVDFEIDEWFELRLEITGPASNVIIQTFFNDEPIHSCTTTSNTVEMGAIGLSAFGSGTRGDFDDVRVTLL